MLRRKRRRRRNSWLQSLTVSHRRRCNELDVFLAPASLSYFKLLSLKNYSFRVFPVGERRFLFFVKCLHRAHWSHSNNRKWPCLAEHEIRKWQKTVNQYVQWQGFVLPLISEPPSRSTHPEAVFWGRKNKDPAHICPTLLIQTLSFKFSLNCTKVLKCNIQFHMREEELMLEWRTS